jgi:methyl coenzyme M reductase subunit D
MYQVSYSTKNDRYTKSFKTMTDALKFCHLIRKLYPEQSPVVVQR